MIRHGKKNLKKRRRKNIRVDFRSSRNRPLDDGMNQSTKTETEKENNSYELSLTFSEPPDSSRPCESRNSVPTIHRGTARSTEDWIERNFVRVVDSGPGSNFLPGSSWMIRYLPKHTATLSSKIEESGFQSVLIGSSIISLLMLVFLVLIA